MANPPGTETAAFVTFAILDELMRALVKKGALSQDDITNVLERTKGNIARLNRAAGPNAIDAVEAMIKEYRK